MVIDAVCSDHRAAAENESEGNATDYSWDGDGHEASGLDCGVAAHGETEEASHHETHHRTLHHVYFGPLDFVFELMPFFGEFGWTFERD